MWGARVAADFTPGMHHFVDEPVSLLHRMLRMSLVHMLWCLLYPPLRTHLRDHLLGHLEALVGSPWPKTYSKRRLERLATSNPLYLLDAGLEIKAFLREALVGSPRPKTYPKRRLECLTTSNPLYFARLGPGNWSFLPGVSGGEPLA